MERVGPSIKYSGSTLSPSTRREPYGSQLAQDGELVEPQALTIILGRVERVDFTEWL